MVEKKFYNRIFEADRDGKEILDELKRLFYNNATYKRGETTQLDLAYATGQRDVIQFILNKTEGKKLNE